MNSRYELSSIPLHPEPYYPSQSDGNTTSLGDADASTDSSLPQNKPYIIWIVLASSVASLIILLWCDRKSKERARAASDAAVVSTSSEVDEKEKQILENPELRRTIYSQVFEVLCNQTELSQENLKPMDAIDIESGKCTIRQTESQDPATKSCCNKDDGVVLAFQKDPKQEDGRCCTSAVCAICLESYQEGETIVWSQDPECCHVYHKDCFVDYLSQRKNPSLEDNPCPTCRRNFCKMTVV
jgi:Ring finger domain